MFKDVFKNFKSHCMTGISYMIPVIVIGGFCTAIARLCGNVDVQGTLGYAFISAGNAAFGLMMSVLCAGVAYSICGKPGIAPGVVAGYLSTQVKASFLGALICGFLMGCMTGFDMGGPVNKICFSVVSAFAASGVWGPAAGKNAAAMAPPLGMAISALILTPKKYTAEEREDAKVAIAMSLCQVTEGALPFAFNDPKRVIPAVTIGSGVAHGLVLAWGVTCPVLHGGVFSIPLTSNPLLWVAAYLIGAMVTAVIVSVLKPARPVEAESEDEELKVDFDIEIG